MTISILFLIFSAANLSIAPLLFVSTYSLKLVRVEASIAPPDQQHLLKTSLQDTAANAGDAVMVEAVDFTIAGVTGTADITDLTFTGGDAEVKVGLLEDGTPDNDFGEDCIIMNRSAVDTDVGDNIVAEDYTSDIAVYTQAGSSSGSASVFNGVTVAAA